MVNYGGWQTELGRTAKDKSYAQRQGEKNMRENRALLDSLIEKHGATWELVAGGGYSGEGRRSESIMEIVPTGEALTRTRLRYWQACGWVRVIHCGLSRYELEVIE